MSDFPLWIEIPVRFRDVDGMRHVNNAVFFTYMEMARGAYWERLGLGGDLDRLEFILARAECDFRAPIPYGETVRVGIRCSRIGSKSWDYEYRLEGVRDGTLFAEASSVQVYFDYARQRAEPIPAQVRQRIEELEVGGGSRG